MRVLGWQVGGDQPSAIADGPGPVELVASSATLDAFAAALYGPPEADPEAIPHAGGAGQPPSSTPAAAVAVAVEIDGTARWVAPSRPARPSGRRPRIDLARVSVAPAAAVASATMTEGAGPAEASGTAAKLVARLDLWRRSLLEGGEWWAGLDVLQVRLADTEHRLERDRAERDRASAEGDGAPGRRDGAPAELLGPEANAADPASAARHAESARILADQQAVLDEDVQLTEEQLAAALADEREMSEELAALSARSSVGAGAEGDPTDERAVLDAVHEALRRRREAEAALEAAGNTASVLRWGLEKSADAEPSWLRWIQPVTLALASGLVMVAVLLLTQGVNGAGIIVAALALVGAVLALFLPARPLRDSPDVQRMRLRLARAEDDGRRWSEEARARSDHLASCATAAGLPAEVGDAVLQRREAELAAGLDVRAAIAARERRRQVARNTTAAARERVGVLRDEQRDLRRHAEELEATFAAPRRATTGPSAGGQASGGLHEAELHQERRSLLEALNRRRWEADRLTVTRWLLTTAAEEAAATAAEVGVGARRARLEAVQHLLAEAAVGSSGPTSADQTLPVLVRGLETWPPGAERAELGGLLVELARSTQVLVLTPAAERPAETAIRVLVTPAE